MRIPKATSASPPSSDGGGLGAGVGVGLGLLPGGGLGWTGADEAPWEVGGGGVSAAADQPGVEDEEANADDSAVVGRIQQWIEGRRITNVDLGQCPYRMARTQRSAAYA